MSVVAISWDQSENRLASPMPSTVRFYQRMSAWHFLLSGVEEGAVIAAKGCKVGCKEHKKPRAALLDSDKGVREEGFSFRIKPLKPV